MSILRSVLNNFRLLSINQKPSHFKDVLLKQLYSTDSCTFDQVKRPLSGYIRFCQAQYPLIKAANPSLTNLEISQMISQKWADEDEDVKNAFNDESAREMAEWKDLMESNEGLKNLRKIKLIEERKTRLLIRLKKVKKELYQHFGRPSRPHNAFFMYRLETRPRLIEDWKSRHIARPACAVINTKLSEMWSNETEEFRNKYEEKYKTNLEAYKKELKEWNIKMKEDQRFGKFVAKLKDVEQMLKEDDSGKPIKPTRPNQMYYRDILKGSKDDFTFRQKFKASKKKWLADEEARIKYRKIFEERMESYKVELDQWKRDSFSENVDYDEKIEKIEAKLTDISVKIILEDEYEDVWAQLAEENSMSGSSCEHTLRG